jgi:DNA topoisomerase I
MASNTGLAMPMASSLSSEQALTTAKTAGLRYVSDAQPGIRRRPAQQGFDYLDADGKRVRDEKVLARIRSLAIPPAWADVWICPWENGHIQATGRDAKRRKQYRYHPRWRSVRDESKFHRMLSFGKALPQIRKQVDADLRLPGLPREKALATVVYLLEATMMRVGNEEYARTNKSFGLTTLRDRHVRVDGSEVVFQFRGKSGVQHAIRVDDRRLARIIKRMRDLPGQELFQYVDDDGERRSVDSSDVNEYLRTLTGEDYTAKDFRTWSGTLLAALALQEYETFDSQAQAKSNVLRAIESVAARLGNTPAVCRKCYVHPAVIDAYLEGAMPGAARQQVQEQAQQALVRDVQGLSPEEAAVLALLQRRLAAAGTPRQAQATQAARRKCRVPRTGKDRVAA